MVVPSAELDLPKRYADALDEVLPALGEQPETVAIFLAGSVTRGAGGPTSDLDLYVIVDAPYRQRRQVIATNGVLAEIFLNPPYEARRRFREDDYSAMHMVGFGKLLFARDLELAVTLQGEARAAYERGPKPVEGLTLVAARYGLVDRYEDALDAMATDPGSAAPVFWRVVDLAVTFHYRGAGRWRPKDKNLLDDLAIWDETLRDLLSSFYRRRAPRKQLALVERILRHVLGTTDSLRIEAWESTAEECLP